MVQTPRPVEIAFSVGFLAIIASTGTIQTAIEVARHERPQLLELFTGRPSTQALRQYEGRMEEASWVAGKLRPWMQHVQFALLHDAGEKALIGRDGWLFYKPGFKYLTERAAARQAFGPPADPLPAILAFRDALAARGIRLLVVPAPNKETVYPEKVTRRARQMPSAVCPRTRELLRQLQAAGVETVDLFAVYARGRQQSTASDQALYLVQDSHWSPRGVELAARAVARRLLQQDWASLRQTDYQTRPAPVRRVGDLLRMLQTPSLEQRVPPEQVPCRQVFRRDTGALYVDDLGAEVLVLGDSFLRIYQQDEPGAAGFIAHLGRELRQPVASLVNDGGASTLVRQELYRRPALLKNKKVVVWEFVERDIRFGAEGWQLVPLPDANLTQPQPAQAPAR
jgi:hypothetical protein